MPALIVDSLRNEREHILKRRKERRRKERVYFEEENKIKMEGIRA